jgi:hypothetical protein
VALSGFLFGALWLRDGHGESARRTGPASILTTTAAQDDSYCIEDYQNGKWWHYAEGDMQPTRGPCW